MCPFRAFESYDNFIHRYWTLFTWNITYGNKTPESLIQTQYILKINTKTATLL